MAAGRLLRLVEPHRVGPGRESESACCVVDGSPHRLRDIAFVFLVGRSAGDPDIVHVTEGWTTPEAHSSFFATTEARALVARLQPLLADEPAYTDPSTRNSFEARRSSRR